MLTFFGIVPTPVFMFDGPSKSQTFHCLFHPLAHSSTISSSGAGGLFTDVVALGSWPGALGHLSLPPSRFPSGYSSRNSGNFFESRPEHHSHNKQRYSVADHSGIRVPYVPRPGKGNKTSADTRSNDGPQPGNYNKPRQMGRYSALPPLAVPARAEPAPFGAGYIALIVGVSVGGMSPDRLATPAAAAQDYAATVVEAGRPATAVVVEVEVGCFANTLVEVAGFAHLSTGFGPGLADSRSADHCPDLVEVAEDLN